MAEEMNTRNQIEEQYKWRLSDIFKSNADWEKSLRDLSGPQEQLLSFKDRIGESAEILAHVLDLEQECEGRMMELYAYAKMNKDLDNADPEYQAMFDRIVGEYFTLSARMSFIAPAISDIEETTLQSWMKEEAKLSAYRHSLENILRNKAHILSENEETILSNAGPALDGIEEAFSMLNNLELDLGDIQFETGETVKLTHGKFGIFREDKDRKIRSQVYEKMHSAFRKFGNTIAAIYTSSVKRDVFFSRTRKFGSCLEQALFADQLPDRIYDRLIESIHESLPSFYRYLSLRKTQMHLDVLHLYDCSVPLVEMPDTEYPFDKAARILLKGLSPLGEEYIRHVETLFSTRSIDVYETPGKTSGAYAWGSYRSHPYMLLNWSGRLNDVFTLAHETGHCLHTFYSNRAQAYVNSQYPIFLAEIASTVNENVLLRFLIEACDTRTLEGKKEKAYLINYFLEGVKNTVFRQTMFAEFEGLIHKKVEEGQPVTSKTLSETYESLLHLYFGKDVAIDDYMSWEWARIPHFYNAFYVYKYATGFCAAAQIAAMLSDEGDLAVTRYLEFLSSGGKDYPMNLLDKMGIDITSPQMVRTTMQEFDEDVALLQDLLEEIDLFEKSGQSAG